MGTFQLESEVPVRLGRNGRGPERGLIVTGRTAIDLCPLSARGESATMRIEMAVGAGCLRWPEKYRRPPERGRRGERLETRPSRTVADRAFDVAMSAIECHSEPGVGRPVETARFPAGHGVTGGAFALAGAIRQLSGVIVGVAVDAAADAGSHDDPGGAVAADRRGCVSSVTPRASHRRVFSLQWVLGRAVLSDREGRRREAGDIVTGSTVDRLPGQRGGSSVSILMAAGAGRERGLLALRRGEIMTLRAGYHRVAAPEWVPGPIMVEGLFVDHLESGCPVAVGAGDAEPSGVRIRVTGGALTMGEWAVHRDGPTCRVALESESRIGVALGTADLRMFPRERIRRRVVREPRSQFPLSCVVALGAVRAERIPVYVVMAGATVVIEAGPDATPRSGGKLGRRGNLKFGSVAIAALRVEVALLKRPSRTRVAEALRGPVRPLDHREVHPGVFRVTRGARLIPESAVHSKPLLDEPSDVLVTSYAQGSHRFLPATMAFRAVERAFELAMYLCERPRRDLSSQGRNQKQGGQRQARSQGPRPNPTHQNQVAPSATTTPT